MTNQSYFNHSSYCLCCQIDIPEDNDFCDGYCRKLWLTGTEKVELEMKENTMDFKIMLNPKKYGYEECDKCHGFGHECGNFEECEKCEGSGLMKSKEKNTEDTTEV